MTTSCLNCGSPVDDKYCSHCGQRTSIERFSWKSLIEELFHFYTHLEHNFFRATFQIGYKPGKILKSILDGKRNSNPKPIGFLIVWITIFVVIFSLVSKITHYGAFNTDSLVTYDSASSVILNKYRSAIDIIILPFTSLIAWLIVAKPKLNYIEVLTTNFYFIAILFVLLSIQMLIAVIFGINFKTDAFDWMTIICYAIWLLYAAFDFYKQYQIPHVIFRIILATILNTIVYFQIGKMWIFFLRQVH